MIKEPAARIFITISILAIAACASVAFFEEKCFADEASSVTRNEVAQYAGALMQAALATEDHEELLGIGDSDAFLLGSPIAAYASLEGRLEDTGLLYWPIISDGQVVAIVVSCASDDGGVSYRLTTALADVVDAFYGSNTQCVIVVENDSERVLSVADAFSTDEVLGSIASVPQEDDIALSMEPRDFFQELAVPEENSSDAADDNHELMQTRSSSRGLTPNLPVRRYSQGDTPLCWSTCVASISFT